MEVSRSTGLTQGIEMVVPWVYPRVHNTETGSVGWIKYSSPLCNANSLSNVLMDGHCLKEGELSGSVTFMAGPCVTEGLREYAVVVESPEVNPVTFKPDFQGHSGVIIVVDVY